MKRAKDNTDKYGSYQNGQFVSVNGYMNTGLLCPKGVRLYDKDHPRPIFMLPDNLLHNEYFVGLTQFAAPGVLPYYAISNYGRIYQIYTGRFMKTNYRPNGYAYFCLANEKGQGKYTLHRMVMLTFRYYPGCEELQVNHKDGDKTHNWVDVPNQFGILEDNLEWATGSYNSKHAIDNNLRSRTNVLNEDMVHDICSLFSQGYAITDVCRKYKGISYATIQAIYERKNWVKISCNYQF